MTVEKPKQKQLLRPITTGTNSAMNQLQFLAITCNSPEAREKSRIQGGIGFGFASHWLKHWRESFKPITKRSNCNRVITFDSHLKTALRAPFSPQIIFCASTGLVYLADWDPPERGRQLDGMKSSCCSWRNALW